MIKWINKKRNKKGFTLIELIVVIAILGILAAIAIPRLSGFTETAKESTDEQMAAVVANAALVYHAANNAIPTMKQLSDGNFIEKEYKAADIQSAKYKAGTPVFTIEPGTSPITVVVTLGGTTPFTVSK